MTQTVREGIPRKKKKKIYFKNFLRKKIKTGHRARCGTISGARDLRELKVLFIKKQTDDSNSARSYSEKKGKFYFKIFFRKRKERER